MSQRRKRLRTLHPIAEGGKSGSLQATYSGDSRGKASKDFLSPESGSTMYECGSFASRCSMRTISGVVSKFDDQKKELVRSIGFHGILDFPPMKQINRKFSLWLISCVDERTATLQISQDVSIGFNKFDVGHVFGIPVGGKCVLDSIAARSDAKDRVIDRYLGVEFREQRNTKIVQEIIEREYGMDMSQIDGERFMVAFVVFVVSNLLSPSAKQNYASVDYWNAIQDPVEIGNYDWGEYVVTKLLEGVAKLKLDLLNNIKFPNISGFCIRRQLVPLDLGLPEWMCSSSHINGVYVNQIYRLEVKYGIVVCRGFMSGSGVGCFHCPEDETAGAIVRGVDCCIAHASGD